MYYFGTPAGDDRFSEGRLPIWLEVGERLMYGLGPVIGELVAGLMLGKSRPDPTLGLQRFSKAKAGAAWQQKWS